MELGVALRASGDCCVIGNGLKECLGCIRKLALGERSQGRQLKALRNLTIEAGLRSPQEKQQIVCRREDVVLGCVCVCGGELESETVLELPSEMSGVPQ